MEKPSVCARCRAPIEQSASGGRPRSYCGAVCRRESEYELRRVERALAGAEGKLRLARLAVATALPYVRSSRADPRAVTFWEEEVAVLEERLRALLSESSDPAET